MSLNDWGTPKINPYGLCCFKCYPKTVKSWNFISGDKLVITINIKRKKNYF